MEIVKTFGHYVDVLSKDHPSAARWLLKTGWELQDVKFRVAKDKNLLPADQYLAHIMMRLMINPLMDPDHSCIVSVFTPCEMMQEVGLHSYNVESMSCYLSGSFAEREFIQKAEETGIAETLCSYHKIFLGAAYEGLLPRPRCIVYTNIACDANLLTFRALSELYDVPKFFIDVPLTATEGNISYVEEQLRDLSVFLEKQTGVKIEESQLRSRVERSLRSIQNYRKFQTLRSTHYIPTDLTTPLYSGITSNVMLGTQEEETYTNMLLQDVEKAEPAQGVRLYWMHIIPFWSEEVRKLLRFQKSAQIVGCEFAQLCDRDFDTRNPYRAMAERMVYNSMYGTMSRRIEEGIRHAKMAGADGTVWFCHWGCKHTMGGSQLAKKKFEEAGIPLLVLDGDGCDRSHGGEGQTATRLGAFLEMLIEKKQHENGQKKES